MKPYHYGLLILLATSCAAPPDPDLKAANRAMSNMATSSVLTQSCFSVVYPDGKASDFIAYVFSDLARAEWPVAMTQLERDQMNAIGQTPLPPNVVLSPFQRRQPNQKELVLNSNDANQVIIAEGYLPGSNQVAFTAQWPLAIAQASEGTRKTCQSNLQMGISPN